MHSRLLWIMPVLTIALLLGLCSLSFGYSPWSTFTPRVLASADAALPATGGARALQSSALLTSTASYTIYLPIIWGTGEAPASAAFFSVGSGSTDVIPHQLVRTADDRLYIFVAQTYSSTIRAYWTTTAGLPNTKAAFAGSAKATESGVPISLDAVYDGSSIIHVLINTRDGWLKDFPFDLSTNAFKSAIPLAQDSHGISGDYLGTSGVSGMVDEDGKLHVAYWSSSNHIIHRAYTYNNSLNTLTQVGSSQQVDTNGSANHPVVAVSPYNNSLTVAWVSEATNPAKILARTRTSAGTWGSVETVSTASVWTSTSAGINIDQGPSLVIGADGTKHLAYIQDYESVSGGYYYGRIHYATTTSSTWTDRALSAFTHDPALALTSAGQLYIIGHGFPINSSCKSESDICTIKKNSDGTWGSPQLFAAHPDSTHTFDSSPSVKWSVVGFNRPQTIEFLFFSTPYANPTVYYARLGG